MWINLISACNICKQSQKVLCSTEIELLLNFFRCILRPDFEYSITCIFQVIALRAIHRKDIL